MQRFRFNSEDELNAALDFTDHPPAGLIYVLTDPREPKAIRYVGKTIKSMKVRLAQHLSGVGERTHKNAWMRALLAAGVVPAIRPLFTWHTKGADWGHAERNWIAELRRLGHPLTNSTDGGDGTQGFIPGPETRAKLSAASKGRKLSTDTKAKLSAAHTGKRLHPEHIEKLRGKKRTPEHIEKLRQARLGKPLSPEARAKQAAALKGRAKSAEHVAAFTEARRNGAGWKPTDEQRAKISETMKARGIQPSEDARRRQREAVTGRERSPEHREKLRQARLGHKFSAEVRERMAASKIGKTASAETKAKMREAQRLAWERRRASKGVATIDTIDPLSSEDIQH
jgi:hypothetical protein